MEVAQVAPVVAKKTLPKLAKISQELLNAKRYIDDDSDPLGVEQRQLLRAQLHRQKNLKELLEKSVKIKIVDPNNVQKR